MDCFEQSDTVMYVMFIVFQNNCKSSPKTDIFSWKFWNFRSTWNRYPNPCHLTGHVVTSRSTPTLIHSTPNRQSSGRQQANQVYYRAGLDISRSVNDNLELVDDADDNIRSLSPASFTIRSTPRIIHPTPSRQPSYSRHVNQVYHEADLTTSMQISAWEPWAGCRRSRWGY